MSIWGWLNSGNRRMEGGAVCLLVFAVAAPAAAGHPGSGTTVSIAGVQVSCPTYAGGAVWWVVTRHGGPAGFFSSRGGVTTNRELEPHVFLNVDVFGALHPLVQLFIALHECAHFAVPPQPNVDTFKIEQEADCWAVRAGIANGWFGWGELDLVSRHLLAKGAAQWGHPESQIHGENITRCR